MAAEELEQDGYLVNGVLKGQPFGRYEVFRVGATTTTQFLASGLAFTLASAVAYPFKFYTQVSHRPGNAKPDNVFCRRVHGTGAVPVFLQEVKDARERTKKNGEDRALEQLLFACAAMGVDFGAVTFGNDSIYLDVQASLTTQSLVRLPEIRQVSEVVIDETLAGTPAPTQNPRTLADSVWQSIWHTTKAEPKECLLTFVELFMFKFLSDNLDPSQMPLTLRFPELNRDPGDFHKAHGMTAIEFYVSTVRPAIKTMFPQNVTITQPPPVAAGVPVPPLQPGQSNMPDVFGCSTFVSKTSIINGFAFMKSSSTTVASYNKAFLDILAQFAAYGPLTNIDPEFKLRLYETFLKATTAQSKLGQFFTPRNVVQQMVRMARLDALADGAVVLDPAAGVGGFLLEPLLPGGQLDNNYQFKNGRANARVNVVGVDVDSNTHILAKANMLIHLADAIKTRNAPLTELNNLMAETFVLMNANETLGALEYPPQSAVDVILSNPPYVTQGSGIYKRAMKDETPRNGQDLSKYYANSGLGLEGLFLRYISGALKPGGIAYVIVPVGLLTRTETALKKLLLSECNLLAAIALPKGTFFNTPQATYILVLKKRYGDDDDRPPVLCALPRSIGESLDQYRAPICENELRTVADAFLAVQRNDLAHPALAEPFIKLVDFTTVIAGETVEVFGPSTRWDVTRHWTQDELVTLHYLAPAVERSAYVSDTLQRLEEIQDELTKVGNQLHALTSGRMEPTTLGDSARFSIRHGRRVTKEQTRTNPGDIPVYSGKKLATEALGSIDEKWLINNRLPIENVKVDDKGHPVVNAEGLNVLDPDSQTVTINANGSVGVVFVRGGKFLVHDDVLVVDILDPRIHPGYLATQIAEAVDRGDFAYEKKLYEARARQLDLSFPVDAQGNYDLYQQAAIAAAVHAFNDVRRRLEVFLQEIAATRVVSG